MDNWQQEYLELMFGKNHTRETMEKAAILKYQYMPNSLYKYRNADKKSIAALRDSVLYSAEPSTFNDYKEVPIIIRSDVIKNRILQPEYDSLRSYYPELPHIRINSFSDIHSAFESTFSTEQSTLNEKELKAITTNAESLFDNAINNVQHSERNRYNLICFSESGNIEQMWAYYANGHRGFCIEYDFKSLGINNELVQLTFPIIYTDYLNVEIYDFCDLNPSVGMFAATLKTTEWRIEKEWRTFFLHSEKPKPERLPKPKSVCLGGRIDSAKEAEIVDICKEKGIKIYKENLVL